MRSASALFVTLLLLSSQLPAALPDPPRQHDPWQAIPATGLPAYMPELVSMLFDAGIADPRGGAYREIEIGIPWGQQHSLVTHGWYFVQGFAVGWDGLVHRVIKGGPEADLWRDVADAKSGHFHPEAMLAAQPTAEPVAVALLLRLGETELARQAFVKFSEAPSALVADSTVGRQDFLRIAVVSWLASAFHQAVEAHATANDQLAIDISELLLKARPRVESLDLAPPSPRTAESPIAFLDPVPALLADSQRRLKNPLHAKFNEALLPGPHAPGRIAALIEHMEDVDERQVSQPGGVDVLGSPICKALAAEGPDIVEPLLDTLEHDQRLTRSYSYHRNFFPPRHLITVSETAEVLLQRLYQLPTNWKDAEQRRAWLIRNKNHTKAERYFDLLQSDTNNESQWLEAATGLITTPADELRQRANPSLSELLAKRANQMTGDRAYILALQLYQWSPKSSLPTLQKASQAGDYGSYYGQVIAARLELGDQTAAQEWATAVKGRQLQMPSDLAPLWTAPDNPVLQSVAERFFSGPDALLPPDKLLATGQLLIGNPLQSPLLIIPIFREAVLATLSRTEPVGKIELRPDGGLDIEAGGTSMACGAGGCGHGFPPSRKPADPHIRLCDYVAMQLAMIEGFPAFDPMSPTTEKDAAIEKLAQFLRANAANFRASAITPTLFPQITVFLKQK